MMHPSLVAVGIGNTSIRFGVAAEFIAGRPRWSEWIESPTAGFDPQFLAERLPSPPATWRCASVHRASEGRLRDWLLATYPQVDYRALTHRDLALEIDLDAPERVGMDRLVAALAVNHLRRPDVAAIVIDAGTAITVDRVSARGVFQGGAILPGMRLIAHALAARTDLLPEVDERFSDVPEALGRSTKAAIRSGLFWGSVGAVRELIAQMRPPAGQPVQVFATGGDAERLVPFLDGAAGSAETCFVADLVMLGIALAGTAG